MRPGSVFRRRAEMLRISGAHINLPLGGLAAKSILILTPAKQSFAARRHTELNGLCLNAVLLGDSPELPRLSSRGFRSENTLGGGLPPTRPVACFTRSASCFGGPAPHVPLRCTLGRASCRVTA